MKNPQDQHQCLIWQRQEEIPSRRLEELREEARGEIRQRDRRRVAAKTVRAKNRV